MNAQEIIEKIRAEIERLKEKYTNMMPSIQKCSVCDELLAKLDTLKEQPTCEGFDGEFSKFSNDVDAEHPFPICVDEFKDFARHFYELGRRSKRNIEICPHTIKSKSYGMNKPKVCEGLEEEIVKVCDDFAFPLYGLADDYGRELVNKLARHFANWQKEQMMKEAVEGRVVDAGIFATYNTPVEYTHSGDKVKLIVIKEEVVL